MNHSTLGVPLATRLATIAFAATLTACAAAADTTVSSTVSGPTSTTDASATTPQALLDDWAAAGGGGVTVALASHGDEVQLLAAGTDGPGGGTLAPDAPFRVGSITKTFVAVMMLQLVADSAIALDDLVTRHAPELTIAQGVTIGQLLAHRTGIPEHTDGELAPAILADPARTWTPNDVLDLVADQPPDFPPGEQFAYSNTNYIVAGLLLERLTGTSLADNLESRIVGPLGLTATYFAPDARREPIGGFSPSLPGGTTDAVPYRALETAAGAAGALVSTAADLSTFIRALAHGELMPSIAYDEMVKGLPAVGHSLGIFPSDPATPTGISNSGSIPGFRAYMQYDPATENLFVLLLNDDSRSPEQLGDALLATLSGA